MDHTEPRHRLLAILAADAAGYSRLMGVDEMSTVAALDAARARMLGEVAARHGRIVDTAGDSVLAVFDTAGGAVEAALAFQRAEAAAQAGTEPERRLEFRVGVHLGDVIEKADGSIYGNGVNIAARLQSLANPGDVWVSDAVRVAVAGLSADRVEDRGAQSVKNIAEPVHAFRLRPERETGTHPWRRPAWRAPRLRFAAVGAVAVALALVWALVFKAGRSPDPAAAQGLRPASLALGPIVADGSDAGAAARAAALRQDLMAALTAPRFRQSLSVQMLDDAADGAGAATTVARARAAGTRYLLEGRLRRVDAQDLTTLSLVDVASGVQRWSGRWPPAPAGDAPPRPPTFPEFAGEIAEQVLNHETRRVLALPVERLTPVELILRGGAVYDAKPTLAGIDEALQIADRALTLGPDFVPALNMKAWLLLNRYDEEAAPDHERYAREVEALTARMLALDTQDPYSWSLRASAMMFAGRWASAAEAIDRLTQIEGPTTFALLERVNNWLQTGRVAEALQTLQSEPLRSSGSSWGPVMECHALLLLARLQAAVEACEKAVGRNPILWSAHLYLASAHALLGHVEQARASLQVVERMSPGHTIARLKAYRPWAHPDYQRLAAQTYHEGLRKAGMPER